MQAMERTKVFPEVEQLTYHPENKECLYCGGPIECCHAVWRKHIITLAGVLFVSNLGFRCTNPDCPHPGVVWRSAIADAMALKGFSYGLDYEKLQEISESLDYCLKKRGPLLEELLSVSNRGGRIHGEVPPGGKGSISQDDGKAELE